MNERVHDYVRTVRTTLEKKLFRTELRISDTMLQNTNLNIVEVAGSHTSKVIAQFEMAVYGQSKKQTYSTTYDSPENWWEHFKLDVLSSKKFFNWYLKKHPVKYTTQKKEITFDHTAVFTDLLTENKPHCIEIHSIPEPNMGQLYNCESKPVTAHSIERDKDAKRKKMMSEFGMSEAPRIWWGSLSDFERINIKDKVLGSVNMSDINSEYIREMFYNF